MEVDSSMVGSRASVRVPVLVALLTVATAVIAAVVPSLLAYTSQSSRATQAAEAELSAAADGVRERVHGFLAEQSSALTCLSTDTGFEEQMSKALEELPEVPAPVEGERQTDEQIEAAKVAKATREAIEAARGGVSSRLKAYCEGRKACKRVVIASKESNVLFSTAATDQGATLGGSLVTSALDSAEPVSLINLGLVDQLGAPAVLAAALPSKERVVIAAFEMAGVFDSLTKVQAALGKGGRVLLVDGRRSALFGELESHKGKSVEIEPVTRALKGESALARTADEQDKVIVAAFRPVAEAGSAVVVARRNEDLTGSDVSFSWGGLIGALVLGLIGGILAFVIIRRAFEPLGMLYQAAVRVAAGDLSERVPVLTEDEVGAISRVWNDVVAKLEQARGGRQGQGPAAPQG